MTRHKPVSHGPGATRPAENGNHPDGNTNNEGQGRQMNRTRIMIVIAAVLLWAATAGAQQAIPEAAKKHLLAGIDAIETDL